MAERLQKVLARAGLGSRRKCEELIAAGRVSVNGKVAQLGTRADGESDEVRVDGALVPVNDKMRYILLNKPVGVLSAVSDSSRRTTVVDLVPDDERVFPVGRLDLDTEGLLILTNDGRLTNLLTHPSRGVEKTYLAEVAGRLVPGGIKKLRNGVDLDDGRTAPARVTVLAEIQGRQLIEIGIHEGRNRQIRRMIESVGGRVAKLSRVAIGPLQDQSLKPGAWRMLRANEVAALYRAAGAEID